MTNGKSTIRHQRKSVEINLMNSLLLSDSLGKNVVGLIVDPNNFLGR